MICNCAAQLVETCANCLCRDDDDRTSGLSSGIAVGEGLSVFDVVGDEPSEPESEDRLSDEL